MNTPSQQPKITLAEQLKRLRRAKGHATARGFAQALGISENRYSRYERGEAVPKLDLVWAICNELSITPNELYGWDPGISPPPVRQTHSGQAAQAGMAETPAAYSHGSGNPALDLAAWRLAVSLAEATSPPSAGKLHGMRATADLFLQLKKDPLEAVARCLQSLDTQISHPDREARIATEVEAFLAAVGT